VRGRVRLRAVNPGAGLGRGDRGARDVVSHASLRTALVALGLWACTGDAAAPRGPLADAAAARDADVARGDGRAEPADAEGEGGTVPAPPDAASNVDVRPSPADEDAPAPDPPRSPDGCADLYADDLLPTFELELEPAEWAALQDEFARPAEREAQGLDPKPYHPVRLFKYGDEVVLDAMIRLKSNPYFSWRGSKMQFVVSFRERDPDGRFHGLRKLSFDAPFYDPTFLHERLAGHYLRGLGLPAPCVNNARLVLDGQYYGLFVNKEHIDREFLERNFDPYPDGNLYKYGWELKTNEDEGDTRRRDLFWQTFDVDALAGLADLHQAVLAWAGEALMPDADGYWCCQHNFYLYDHPRRGFLWIPFDLDYTFNGSTTFALIPSNWGLVYPNPAVTPPHLRAVLHNPGWSLAYEDAVRRAWSAYDVPDFQARLARWSAQIAEAYDTDPHLPFPREAHVENLEGFNRHLEARHDFVGRWLSCQAGQDPRDGDLDGVRWCQDCDDADPNARPGAAEVCDDRDTDCDGAVDEGLACRRCFESTLDAARFSYCEEAVDGFQAHARCRANGGTLVVPASVAEQAHLVEQATAFGLDTPWIGPNDLRVEGQFVNPDGDQPLDADALAPYWGAGQPNGGVDQNCVVLEPLLGGAWADRDCGEPHPIVCRLSP